MTAVGWIRSEVASVISNLLLHRQLRGPPVLSWSSENALAELKKYSSAEFVHSKVLADSECKHHASSHAISIGRSRLGRSRFPPANFECLPRQRLRRAASASRPVATACGGDAELAGEGVDRISAAQARALDGPVRQDHRERHGQVAFPGQIGELERECRALEIELESVCERPT